MEKSAILLISDIHYNIDKKKSRFVKSEYYQRLENYLLREEKEKGIKIKYLIVTGDIADDGEEEQYEAAAVILNNLCCNLEIEKNNVLMIPGNHDVNRTRVKLYCKDNKIEESKAANLFDIKLKDFKEFYEKFFEQPDFHMDKAILSSIKIEELGVKIIGLNSLVKESHRDEDHMGYIDIEKLKQELKILQQENTDEIFVAAHHSFTVTRNNELATLKNAKDLIDSLMLSNVNTYIYGHHHTSGSRMECVGDRREVYRYIEVGCLGKILSNENGESYANRFSLAVCENGELDLHDYAYLSDDWGEVNENKYVHQIPVKQSSLKKKKR